MHEIVLSDGSRGVWPEVRKIKWKKRKMACSMDGCNDNDDIAIYFQTNIWNCITLCHMIHLK